MKIRIIKNYDMEEGEKMEWLSEKRDELEKQFVELKREYLYDSFAAR